MSQLKEVKIEVIKAELITRIGSGIKSICYYFFKKNINWLNL